MAGEIDENVVLDYAVFQISPSQNSYEAFVCSKGTTEKLATGPIDQLMLHLREVLIQSDSSFKLQVIESLNGSSWFTKLTIARFLHIVNLPEVLKITFAIANEMTQLEETREFQIALYSKGHVDHAGGGTDCLKEAGLMQKIKVATTSSDVTKNELLRAMDLRLAVLKEELVVSFDRAVGAACSTKQISDLAAFTQYFGAIDLRSFMSKYLELIAMVQLYPASVEQSTISRDIGNKLEEIFQPVQLVDLVKSSTNGISPAKTAQAERRSSSESEEGSSDSSDEDQSFAERSRPAIRPASPKRSASPMRRIQIGRSGSRRSTALTIKSLNYFPARERTASIRGADGTNSDDEESNQPPKKPDNAVRRMSVQDAINLFESKQKDQNMDVQKRKTSAEVSVSAKKSVLRRWSAGMTDSFAHCPPENATEVKAEEKRSTEVKAEEKRSTEVEAGSDYFASKSNLVGSAEVSEPSEMDRMSSPPKDNPPVLVLPKVEEICDRTLSSSEWSRQKEAELNQMLMKMMENKPGKYRGAKTGSDIFQDISSEQRLGFHSQYKEKKNEKLRAENGRVRAQYKTMEETLDLSKAKIPSKTGKQDQLNHAQRLRRNSSPPVLPKKEVPKAIVTKRTPSKSSPLPGTRNSWSSGPLPRTTPAKPSPGSISSNSAPNHRKPSPRPLQQPKGTKGALTDAKPSSRGQEQQQRAVTKTSISAKSKILSAAEDDSGVKSAKPSFYNKVAKRSSVVPLESKPFLRKGTGIGPGIGPVLAKTKVSQSDDSSKNSGSLVQADMASETAASISKIDAYVGLEVPVSVGNGLIQEAMEDPSQSSDAMENSFKNSEVLPVSVIQHSEDVCISSAAWVEVECQEASASCDNCSLPQNTTSPLASSNPRVRHSLSQMLQAESGEPDAIEWGNAEIPPALIYQKDAPKGLKRLLKFARKSTNSSGWTSSSVFSDGEDELEESKAATSKRCSDRLGKSALRDEACGPQAQTIMFSERFDGQSKKSINYQGMHEILSVQSSAKNPASPSSEKLREGHISAAAASSTKATRSFFSLSAFRRGKSSERKLR